MIPKNEIVVYKSTKKLVKDGLFLLVMIFFGLTLPLLIRGEAVETRKLMGLAGFWLLGIILTILPFTFKLEIGNDYVNTYFLGFRVRNLRAGNILMLEYGNLFRFGGLGIGKGIKGWEKGKYGSKYFSIGERAYGKEAIAHAKRVLESRL